MSRTKGDSLFAITTAIFTFVIMLAAYKWRKPETMTPGAPQQFRKITDTLIISIILCLWIGLALATNLEVIVVPPVFALIFELFHTEKFNWRLIPSRLAVLTLTAIFSVGVFHLLSGSIIWVGLINVLITLILCVLFKTPVPIAFGVSLMPLIVPAWGSWAFPVGVFVTTGVLMSLSAAYRQLRNKQGIQQQFLNRDKINHESKPPRLAAFSHDHLKASHSCGLWLLSNILITCMHQIRTIVELRKEDIDYGMESSIPRERRDYNDALLLF
ncbi:hypothetical protein [Paenibacillus qinlingensis]|uniref:HPP family protein n=1 Tax=Paenibacillus qinlingensis TaxID=1837343 RepID=A0ABU1NT72_9BACL|nr:hypothetical protein [Paenibacillus qinlingensis]MDR6550251.1 hypothetical protein [Paenibacillus qinlingensis]